MALLEDRTAVFIVRVWCELGDNQGAVSEWRGSIEHMQSEHRIFFRHLDKIIQFMKPHLQEIGIDETQRFWECMSSAIDDNEPASGTKSDPVPARAAPTGPGLRRKRP